MLKMENQLNNASTRKKSNEPQFLLDYLNYMKDMKGISPKSSDTYRYNLMVFLRFLSHRRSTQSMQEMTLHRLKSIDITHMDAQSLCQVDLNDLHAFLLFAEGNLNNSANSRANKVSTLRTFFHYLYRKAKLIQYNPTLELESPKIPKLQPRYLTLDESRHLLKSIKGPFHERDYAIITLLLNCGMRRSELTGIDLYDIRDNALTILGKGNMERTIYLNQACQQALEVHLKGRLLEKTPERNALFLDQDRKRISPMNVYQLVKVHLAAAGLDTSKYSTHKLRHTAATLMYIHGGVDVRAIQEILGHKKISSTEIYTHLDEKTLREAADRHPLAHLHPGGRKRVRKQ